MASSRQWWRRVRAATKDKWSICLARAAGARHLYRRKLEMETAVIRATSHDDRSVDYKSAGRVFAWARAAPSSLLAPLVWSVAHRASRTRSWPVALKCLLLAHGLLLCSEDAAPPASRVGRLPFDLSDFRDPSSSTSPGFSAFVRAYFRFLDRRSLFSAIKGSISPSHASPETGDDQDDDLERLEQLQDLLDLLMQIQPYADGMEVRLVLEAMDCAVIEIFEVYSGICSGIAHLLVGILRPDPAKPEMTTEALDRRGAAGMRVLRRAASQNAQLSAYFDLCHALGVLNAAELPPVEGIPDKDMDDIERLVLDGSGAEAEAEEDEKKKERHEACSAPVITEEWFVFEDEPWALTVKSGPAAGPVAIGDLIDLS